LRAHFLQGDRWVRRGTPPPASYHLKTQGNTIERDANGNAITVNASGQPVPRLPFIELGEARFVTGLVGSYDNVKTLADLGFPSQAALRQGFKSKVDDYLSAGYIVPGEATAMRSRAALCPPMTYTHIYRDQYDKFVDSTQPSTALPNSIRKISIQVAVTNRPLPALPMNSPWCVPRSVPRTTTRFPSAMTYSTDVMRSGKAAR
jgi:hypothetical protein